jgi:kynurenine 3-monooxygenase
MDAFCDRENEQVADTSRPRRFYGQGLNCGLEDVRVFNSYLENYAVGATTSRPLGDTDPQLAKTLAAYSSERDKNLRAICQLAMQN